MFSGFSRRWWGLRGSNPEPAGYEPAALTDCAKAPYIRIQYSILFPKRKAPIFNFGKNFLFLDKLGPYILLNRIAAFSRLSYVRDRKLFGNILSHPSGRETENKRFHLYTQRPAANLTHVFKIFSR